MATYDRDEHVLGYGKSIAFSDSENGSYTTIAGTIDVQLPERELGAAEITNDDSEDYHKDYTPRLYEPGTASFSYKYTASQFAELETVYQLASDAGTRASATKWWKVTLPDGEVHKFRGFLTKHDLPVEIEEVPTVESEIQVCGKMNAAVAS